MNPQQKYYRGVTGLFNGDVTARLYPWLVQGCLCVRDGVRAITTI